MNLTCLLYAQKRVSAQARKKWIFGTQFALNKLKINTLLKSTKNTLLFYKSWPFANNRNQSVK